MVGSSKSLQFYNEEEFFKIAPQFLDAVCCRLVNLCSSLHPKGPVSLKRSFYIQSCYWLTWLNLISCQTFLHLFFDLDQLLFQQFVAPFQLFWDVLLPWKSKWANVFHEMVKMVQFQHLTCYLCTSSCNFGCSLFIVGTAEWSAWLIWYRFNARCPSWCHLDLNPDLPCDR